MVGTALITGCSSGIGRATVETFLDAGWRVYATSRDPEAVEPFDANATEGGGEVTVLSVDVTDQSSVDRAVERVVREEGRIDCLVNNAGYGQFGPLEDVPAAAVREQFEVNVFGPHRFVRAALPHMRERGEGVVVNVGSVDGRLPLAGIGAYSGSKFALAGMSASLRQEVAGHGVSVVVIEPGLVATGFYRRALAALDGTDRSPAYDDVYRVLERIDLFEDDVPGVCEPEAVAGTILTAATADDPDPRYQVGPLGTPAVLAAGVLPPSWRDGAVRLGVGVAASAPVQRLLGWLDDRRSSRG